MTPQEAREIGRDLFFRLNRAANIDAGLNGRPLSPTAKRELAALDVLLSDPGTCQTCQHGRHMGQSADDGHVRPMCCHPSEAHPLHWQETTPSFGCTLHTPKPGGPDA